MKVLVTGVTGFVGSKLANRLLEEGYDVWGLARFTASGVPKYIQEVKTYTADLTDPYSIAQAIKTIRPDIVFHLGAITPVSMSYYQPKLYMETNYFGTINLVEAITKFCENFELFVYASTSEVYGNQKEFPIKESATPKPNTPYAISKLSGEYYCNIYAREAFDFPCIVARPFNTYNRSHTGQTHFVIEKIITNMLRGVETLTLGDPNPIRDFIFIDDVIEGYMSILRKFQEDDSIIGEVFNLSTGRGVTIKQLVEIAKKVTGWDGEVIWNTHVRPADIKILIGDNSRAKDMLKWSPKYDLEEGLKKTAEDWKSVLF